jgi:hypothetical protein
MKSIHSAISRSDADAADATRIISSVNRLMLEYYHPLKEYSQAEFHLPRIVRLAGDNAEGRRTINI